MVLLQRLLDVLRPRKDGVFASRIEFPQIRMMECVYRCRANGRGGVDPESKGDTGLTR
jgi:hypothetical protein